MKALHENVPLAPYTTFHIGGPAKYLMEAETSGEVVEAFEFAHAKKIPVTVLAGGSNVLFSDQGFNGLVIVLKSVYIKVHEEEIEAGSGAVLQDVIDAAIENGLSGVEALSGVPGSFGGALRGNAGAFGTEIGDCVKQVAAVDLNTGIVKVFSPEECKFSYRSSFFKKKPSWVILSASLALKLGKKETLRDIKRETIKKREAKHPQSAQCAGSFFMNPTVTDQKLLDEFQEETGTPSRNGRLPAGWLITKVGLRGKKIGGAQISPRHPNYLLNTGNATAEEVVMLASLVKTRVRDELGVQLQEEVQFLGF